MERLEEIKRMAGDHRQHLLKALEEQRRYGRFHTECADLYQQIKRTIGELESQLAGTELYKLHARVAVEKELELQRQRTLLAVCASQLERVEQDYKIVSRLVERCQTYARYYQSEINARQQEIAEGEHLFGRRINPLSDTDKTVIEARIVLLRGEIEQIQALMDMFHPSCAAEGSGGPAGIGMLL